MGTVSDYEFLTAVCKLILDPVRAFEFVTEEEKQDILAFERDMEEIMAAEDWPPYDFALEL